MYVYLYLYIYIYIYIYIYLYIYISISLSLSLYIYIYILLSTHFQTLVESSTEAVLVSVKNDKSPKSASKAHLLCRMKRNFCYT